MNLASNAIQVAPIFGNNGSANSFVLYDSVNCIIIDTTDGSQVNVCLFDCLIKQSFNQYVINKVIRKSSTQLIELIAH